MTNELAEQAVPVELPVLRIAPPRGWLDIDFKELWSARELIYFFVWRDIKVRYKQTAIGAALEDVLRREAGKRLIAWLKENEDLSNPEIMDRAWPPPPIIS